MEYLTKSANNLGGLNRVREENDLKVRILESARKDPTAQWYRQATEFPYEVPQGILLEMVGYAHNVLAYLRRKFEEKPIEFDLQNLRILTPDNYDRITQGLKFPFESNGFQDPFQHIVYARAPERQSLQQQMILGNALIHEKVHNMHNHFGLSHFSRKLDEGITQTLTRDIIGMLRRNKPNSGIVYNPSYVEEVKMIDAIKRKSFEIYTDLHLAAIRGEALAAAQIVQVNLGADVSIMMALEQVPTDLVTEKINNYSKAN